MRRNHHNVAGLGLGTKLVHPATEASPPQRFRRLCLGEALGRRVAPLAPGQGAHGRRAGVRPAELETDLAGVGATRGDLALQPNDHITVTEYMNAEWWKGRSSRTGQVGIFPRSYVKVDEKAPPASTTNNYGNAPLEVSGELRYSVPRPLAELC